MNYRTVHVTSDEGEVDRLRVLFQENHLDFRIVPGEKVEQGVKEWYVQVPERNKTKARNVLHNSGILNIATPKRRSTAVPGKKWVLVFLAALVLILVAILMTWFMNTS